jgi:hypothetical protein
LQNLSLFLTMAAVRRGFLAVARDRIFNRFWQTCLMSLTEAFFQPGSLLLISLAALNRLSSTYGEASRPPCWSSFWDDHFSSGLRRSGERLEIPVGGNNFPHSSSIPIQSFGDLFCSNTFSKQDHNRACFSHVKLFATRHNKNLRKKPLQIRQL